MMLLFSSFPVTEKVKRKPFKQKSVYLILVQLDILVTNSNKIYIPQDFQEKKKQMFSSG